MIVKHTTRVVAAGVFLLLVAGALVTSTESGLAVPDWPLSYGRLMPPMVGGIFYEHGHRLVAAAVSFLVGVQVAIVWRFSRRRDLRTLSVLAFGAILLQAVLGGVTVLFLLPPAVSSAHAGLAEIVFALCASLALRASPGFEDGSLVSPTPERPLRLAYRAALWATAAVYLQIMLGAVMRHTAAGLAVPDLPLAFGRLWPTAAQMVQRGVAIHMSHRAGALLVTVLVLSAAFALRRLAPVSRLLGFLGSAWIALLVTQVVLGGLSVYTKKAVPVTTAHLAVGALTWVVGVAAAQTLARALRSEPSRISVASSAAAHAGAGLPA